MKIEIVCVNFCWFEIYVICIEQIIALIAWQSTNLICGESGHITGKNISIQPPQLQMPFAIIEWMMQQSDKWNVKIWNMYNNYGYE